MSDNKSGRNRKMQVKHFAICKGFIRRAV